MEHKTAVNGQTRSW